MLLYTMNIDLMLFKHLVQYFLVVMYIWEQMHCNGQHVKTWHLLFCVITFVELFIAINFNNQNISKSKVTTIWFSENPQWDYIVWHEMSPLT